MKLENIFLSIFIILFFNIIIVSSSNDDIFIINENKLIKNNEFTVILTDIIKLYDVDEKNLYITTNKNLYILNNSNGNIFFKIPIENLNKISVSLNYVYVSDYENVYKINKSLGIIETKYYLKNNEIFANKNGLTENIKLDLTKIFFLHNISTTDTPYSSRIMNETFSLDFPISYINTSSISNGNTLIATWTSPSMGLTFIPHGIHDLHIHGLKIGSGGTHVMKYFYECGYTNSTGGNLTLVQVSDLSSEITTTLPYGEFDVDMLMPDIHLNSTDRMFMRLYVNQTGVGLLPNLQTSFNDLTDSSLRFNTQSILNYQNGILISKNNV